MSPSVHRRPPPSEQAATLFDLDEMARQLGYPGIRTRGAGLALARAVGVSPATVCRYARGVRALSAWTAADWAQRLATRTP